MEETKEGRRDCLQETTYRINREDDIEAYLYPRVRQGLTSRLERIRLTDLNPDIRVVYLQPEATGAELTIDFERFAGYLENQGGPISLRFAESVRRWKTPAGSVPPRKSDGSQQGE